MPFVKHDIFTRAGALQQALLAHFSGEYRCVGDNIWVNEAGQAPQKPDWGLNSETAQHVLSFLSANPNQHTHQMVATMLSFIVLAQRADCGAWVYDFAEQTLKLAQTENINRQASTLKLKEFAQSWDIPLQGFLFETAGEIGMKLQNNPENLKHLQHVNTRLSFALSQKI